MARLDIDRLVDSLCTSLVAAALAVSLGLSVQAQQPVFSGPGRPSPEQMKAIAEAQQKSAAEAAKSAGEKPKSDDEKKQGDEKDKEDKEKKEKEDNSSIKRPEKPPRVPDPREFDVKLEKGRVPPFNFIGQTWPDVLQWYANIAGCSLDWQELPNDYLNLTTTTSYSLDEVRDLLNGRLLARGYTMVVGKEVLSVLKIANLEPSLVPRVSEDELYDRKPYDFVKVSFELPAGMEVDKAKDDMKQVLGPHAKIFPLAATRRILVMDAVANLRTVSELLNQERLVQSGRIIPKEFPLKYARAEQIIDVLYVMVGLDPKSRPSQMELQLQQQKLQLMMQIQQKGQDVSKMLKQDGPPVYLAYNRQRNSVLVNAPPEYMKIIERAIKYLDVPAHGAEGAGFATEGGPGDSREFKKYPLTTLDPERFVSTLEELGGLDPWTELRADKQSNSLFVQGSPADQARIARLIKQFDGEGPRFLRASACGGFRPTWRRLDQGADVRRREEGRGPRPPPLRFLGTTTGAARKRNRIRTKASTSPPTWRTTGSCCGPRRRRWRTCAACWRSLAKCGRSMARSRRSGSFSRWAMKRPASGCSNSCKPSGLAPEAATTSSFASPSRGRRPRNNRRPMPRPRSRPRMNRRAGMRRGR